MENLSHRNEKSYLACPYCLTAVETETTKEEPQPEIPEVEQLSEVKIQDVKEQNESPTAASCPHHFGYLSARSKDGKIPEDCMMCEKIVQCMLKTVRQ